jgi:SPP1 gp7 family putative phage head morphogenesis protein
MGLVNTDPYLMMGLADKYATYLSWAYKGADKAELAQKVKDLAQWQLTNPGASLDQFVPPGAPKKPPKPPKTVKPPPPRAKPADAPGAAPVVTGTPYVPDPGLAKDIQKSLKAKAFFDLSNPSHVGKLGTVFSEQDLIDSIAADPDYFGVSQAEITSTVRSMLAQAQGKPAPAAVAPILPRRVVPGGLKPAYQKLLSDTFQGAGYASSPADLLDAEQFLDQMVDEWKKDKPDIGDKKQIKAYLQSLIDDGWAAQGPKIDAAISQTLAKMGLDPTKQGGLDYLHQIGPEEAASILSSHPDLAFLPKAKYKTLMGEYAAKAQNALNLTQANPGVDHAAVKARLEYLYGYPAGSPLNPTAWGAIGTDPSQIAGYLNGAPGLEGVPKEQIAQAIRDLAQVKGEIAKLPGAAPAPDPVAQAPKPPPAVVVDHPDGQNAEEEAKKKLEQQATADVGAALQEQKAEALQQLGIPAGPVDPNWQPPDPLAQAAAGDPSALAAALPADGLRRTVKVAMENGADLGVEMAIETLEGIGLSARWDLPHAQAKAWADTYSYELVKGINDTTAKRLGGHISQWIQDGRPLVDLQMELAPIWGEYRADLIAVTEVTRAYHQGNLTLYKSVPGVAGIVWKTARDEWVCEICRPMHGAPGDLDGVFMSADGRARQIPAHPNCRCTSAPVVSKGALPSTLPATAPKPVAAPPPPAPAPVVVPPPAPPVPDPATAPAAPEPTAKKAKTPKAPKPKAPKKAKTPPAPTPDPAGAPPPAPVAPAPPPPVLKPQTISDLQAVDTGTLKTWDLHEMDPTWQNPPGHWNDRRYGGVIINDQGQVLLREPTGHFGGYAWTFPKGGPDNPNEHPADIALREVAQETGHKTEIVGMLPGAYESGGPKRNYFFVMRSTGHDPSLMDKETNDLKWVDWDEAEKLINLTPNDAGRIRDLKILAQAKSTHQGLMDGTAQGFPPPVPLKPKAVAAPPPVVPPPPPAKAPKGKKTAPAPVAPGAPAPVPGKTTGDRANWPKEPNLKPVGAPPVARTLPPAKREKWDPVGAPFPEDAEGLELVKRLGGSTGAELVRDPKTGIQYVRKRGKDAGHLMEEVAADQAYQAMGVRVPPLQVYKGRNGEPVKLAQFIPGRTLGEIQASDPKLYKKVVKDLQSNFAADAIMGNWDVIGMGADNVLVDADGNAWRIDNGGSLRRRAQGALKKPEEWDGNVGELWSLRDPQFKNNADVFGGVDYADVVAQMGELTDPAQRAKILSVLPDEVKPVMEARLDQYASLYKSGKALYEDNWRTEYVDKFNSHQVGLSKAGITPNLPKVLGPVKMQELISMPGRENTTVVDENGRDWDSLRGKGSLTSKTMDYMKAKGGNPKWIESWASGQARNSWADAPQAGKMAMVKNRETPMDAYWWKEGLPQAQAHYDHYRQKYGDIDESMAILHAYTYEIMDRVDFPLKDAATGTIRLMRTEDQGVIKHYGLKVGKPTAYKRGAVESTSIYQKVAVCGSEMVIQDVPLHRVMGTYWMQRDESGQTLFLGDSENEFVAMLEGIEGQYTGRYDQFKYK